MDMHPKEKELAQRRTIEAAQKDMIGPAGKLGVIARQLGSVIVSQCSGLHEYNDYDLDPYEQDQATDNELPVYHEEDGADFDSRIQGLVFDGLSRGMHIEIKYKRFSAELTCYYKGYKVYQEVAGDIYAYSPSPEWEDMIESLFKVAQKQQRESQKEQREVNEVIAKKQKESFLQSLRTRWGI